MATEPPSSSIVGRVERWVEAARKLQSLMEFKLSNEEIVALSLLQEPEVQRVLAARPDLPAPARLNLARSGEPGVLQALACRPPYSGEMVDILLASDNEELRAQAVSGGTLSEEQIERILQDPKETLGYPLLQKEGLPLSIRARTVWRQRRNLGYYSAAVKVAPDVRHLLANHTSNGDPYTTYKAPTWEITKNGWVKDPDAWYRSAERWMNPAKFPALEHVTGWKDLAHDQWRVIAWDSDTKQHTGLFYLPKDFNGITVATVEPDGLALSGESVKPDTRRWRSPQSSLPRTWAHSPDFQLHYQDAVETLPEEGAELICRGHAFASHTIYALWTLDGAEIGWTEEDQVKRLTPRHLQKKDFLPEYKEHNLEAFLTGMVKIRQLGLYL